MKDIYYLKNLSRRRNGSSYVRYDITLTDITLNDFKAIIQIWISFGALFESDLWSNRSLQLSYSDSQWHYRHRMDISLIRVMLVRVVCARPFCVRDSLTHKEPWTICGMYASCNIKIYNVKLAASFLSSIYSIHIPNNPNREYCLNYKFPLSFHSIRFACAVYELW